MVNLILKKRAGLVAFAVALWLVSVSRVAGPTDDLSWEGRTTMISVPMRRSDARVSEQRTPRVRAGIMKLERSNIRGDGTLNAASRGEFFFDGPRVDSLRKGPTIMSVTNSRREFLGQGVQALGLLAWAGHQPVNALAVG